MASIYDSVCAVSLKTGNVEGTCSGILIDNKQGIVLTHASLVYPIIDKISHFKLMKLIQDGSADQRIISEPVEVDIFLPNRSNETDGNMVLNDKTVHLVNSLSRGVQESRSYVTHRGKLKTFFVCKKLQDTLLTQMPSETWQFVDDITSVMQKPEHKVKTNSKKDEICYKLLPFFIVIKLLDYFPTDSVLSIRDSVDNKPGDMVEICATPFGSMSPEVFLNSKSHGIMSKLAGHQGVLQMTDARCVPGCEGGALFYCHKGKRILTGIMVATLCWKNNEWVGLSLACAITDVLGSLKTHMQISINRYPSSDYPERYSMVRELTKLVPCITVGHNWGSGVVLDGRRGLVLTCSHVLNPVTSRRGHINIDDQPCSLLYRTPVRSHFDVAIIKSSMMSSSPYSNRLAKFSKAFEGEVVYLAGHAIFQGRAGLLPLVTRGIVSKIVRQNNIPVMLQTTCAVHAGASGGGVFNTKGDLVAIVVCNSRDSLSGASYPHVNMCIPLETISSVITEFLKSEDLSILRSLHIKNDAVQRVWSIGVEGRYLKRNCIMPCGEPVKKLGNEAG